MGACLDPTPAMTPWWNIEMRGESAYLYATVYNAATSRERFEEGVATPEELDASWVIVDAERTQVPGTPEAFIAMLDQILGHPGYPRWIAEGGEPRTTARAEGVDGRLVITAELYRYEEGREDGRLGCVEIVYEDVAALRAAVAALI
ncbi:hypothetical protein [Streptomyces sp. NRRL S-350]|uniref:hypothetical protein n=1 Tax=Streptomyces sp. NRRL S-350 TaxID=1463902 RepID=UPI0004BE5CA4|nr:hypothetical protein [Streptomyces sp. NRRL S-350]